MILSKGNVSDITFIGAGIASAYTLLKYLEELSKLNTSNTLYINIIEKYPEFFCGIPYGQRSGNSVLLINSLREFLPDDERALFISWLKERKKDLIEEFLRCGGEESKRWLSNNIKDIEIDCWDELFVPRSFFGNFIVSKVKKAIEQAEGKKLVKINYIVSEVIDLQKENNQFEIKLIKEQSLLSEKVVISIGSLPKNRIYSKKRALEESDFLLINDIYDEELDLNFNKIESFLLNRKEKETNILIIGANASCLEIIYRLNNKREVNNSIDNYIILSTYGLMPDTKVSNAVKNNYYPEHLNNLQTKNELTAKNIKDAAFKDLELAEKSSLGSGSIVDSISNALITLLEKLNKKEKEIFACNYGNEIGRRQRCAGIHYTSVLDKLKMSNKFIHVAGKFSKISKYDKSKYKFEYVDTKTSKNITYQKDIHLVVNCIGSIDLENQNVPDFIKNIMTNEFCIANDSKIGFKVNNKFESSKNFFISGPLLAGNVIKGKALWHLEHCGRIIWTSNLLGKSLIKKTNTNLITLE